MGIGQERLYSSNPLILNSLYKDVLIPRARRSLVDKVRLWLRAKCSSKRVIPERVNQQHTAYFLMDWNKMYAFCMSWIKHSQCEVTKLVTLHAPKSCRQVSMSPPSPLSSPLFPDLCLPSGSSVSRISLSTTSPPVLLLYCWERVNLFQESCLCCCRISSARSTYTPLPSHFSLCSDTLCSCC